MNNNICFDNVFDISNSTKPLFRAWCEVTGDHPATACRVAEDLELSRATATLAGGLPAAPRCPADT